MCQIRPFPRCAAENSFKNFPNQEKGSILKDLRRRLKDDLMAVGMILLGGCERRMHEGLGGIRVYISPGNFEKSSCRSPLFLYSESHFIPPSQIKRTFLARDGVRTHLSHSRLFTFPVVPPRSPYFSFFVFFFRPPPLKEPLQRREGAKEDWIIAKLRQTGCEEVQLNYKAT